MRLSLALGLWALMGQIPSPFWRIVLRLPSTLLHELCHWVVALVTVSSPGLPSIWPRRVAGGWILGHVQFRPRMFTCALVALAPLGLVAPVLIWALQLPSAGVLWRETLLVTGLSYLLMAGVPSSADLAIAAQDPMGLLVLAGVGYWGMVTF